MVLIRVLSTYPVAFLAVVPAEIIAAVALGVRKVRRGGEPALSVVRQRRQRARARLDSADKRHAQVPLAAGYAAFASFPAVFLALAATGSFDAQGVYLPPAADARWQLWCIAIAVAGAVVALDFWFGLGTCVRALAADGFTAVTEFGIHANRDLVLVSPGNRKALVVKAVSTLTGMRLKEVADLVDNAPGLVMRQVTSERADRAKELLESLGATVTVSSGLSGITWASPRACASSDLLGAPARSPAAGDPSAAHLAGP
jgi:ribosomal protein L7/L12